MTESILPEAEKSLDFSFVLSEGFNQTPEA
jgi:hypothetical protein